MSFQCLCASNDQCDVCAWLAYAHTHRRIVFILVCLKIIYLSTARHSMCAINALRHYKSAGALVNRWQRPAMLHFKTYGVAYEFITFPIVCLGARSQSKFYEEIQTRARCFPPPYSCVSVLTRNAFQSFHQIR